MKSEYYCKTYSSSKVVLFFIIPWLVMAFSSIVIFQRLNKDFPSKFYFYAVMILFFAPVIFQNFFKNLFKHRAYIELSDNYIKIFEFNNKDNEVNSEHTVEFDNIVSFSLSGYNKELKNIIFILKNGRSRKIAFNDYELNEDALNDENHFFRMFLNCLANYNRVNSAKIFVNKGFGNSKEGWIVLICGSILFSVGVILSLIYKPDFFYVPAGGLIFSILGYFSGRSKEMEAYESVNEVFSKM